MHGWLQITLTFEPSSDGGPVLRISGERDAPTVLQRLAPFTPAPDGLAAFAGDYVSSELDSTYAIASSGGGLVVRIPGRQPIGLQPIYPDGFAGSLIGVLTFTRDADHRITGFTLNASSACGLRFARAASGCPQ